jgi:hypothetical protein
MWPGAGRRPPREKQASAASHVDASAADLLYTQAIPDGVKCQPSDQRRMTANAGDLRGLARAALDRPGDPGGPADSRARAFTSGIARRQDARLSGEFRPNDLGAHKRCISRMPHRVHNPWLEVGVLGLTR